MSINIETIFVIKRYDCFGPSQVRLNKGRVVIFYILFEVTVFEYY